MHKKYIPVFLAGFFLVLYAFRLMDSFMLRTDQGPAGELFTHKIIGIALMIAVVFFLRLTPAGIGFKQDLFLRGILIGIAIAAPAYITAYVAEIIIAALQGKSPSLQFYAATYNILGNTALGGGIWIIPAVIMGNIINVIMENSIFSGVMITAAEKRHSFFIANGFYSSFLFGLWHSIMPLRNFVDGEQSLTGTVLSALLLFGSSFIFSVQTGMQFKQANSSLWDGMVVHFINNASVNLIHVVFADGTESNPTMRIAIAQTIMFIVVAARYFGWKKATARQERKGRLYAAD
ncbi:MAG: CPBP family intramembrane metalloprotease [Treponema sp.]|nr:CPBP family intramembrane metalloprotease [Treponema sp.]